MTKFTARDLDRRSAAVLSTCDEEGEVMITHRDGRTYYLKRIVEEPAETPKIPDFESRKKSLGMPQVPREISDVVDRLIAGEYED